ncbi:Thermolabile hemolysin [Smittium mucronatum]|uniref:Thermolabile hemolysin n=1 Tax=Smittium mucronatum TaxID=133383 RepID=A0A1R0GWB2_9FUNG|nr:Thermolabile hemolysin [Smittium mucronatum]
MYSFKNISFIFSLLASGIQAQRLVVFGNSISDVNNKINFANSSFVVPYFFGRYSSGPVWNEYLSYFNNYTLINYAVGGALSNNTFVNDLTNDNITLPSALDQIELWRDTFHYVHKSELKKDIAVIEIGANDIFYTTSLILSNGTSIEEFSTNLVENIMHSVNRLVDIGFVNIIVSQIPNLVVSPSVSSLEQDQKQILADLAKNINEEISSKVSCLSSNLKSGWAKVLELYDLFDIIVNTPQVNSALGIPDLAVECFVVNDTTNVLVSSCNDPDLHLFIDAYHPETRPHSLIGALASQMINNSSFSLDSDSTLSMISSYNITQFGYALNPLFTNNTNSTGILKIREFNITTSKLHAKEIYPKKRNRFF